MDVPSMFNLIRELTHTNSDDYPDTRLLPFLNVVKDDLWAYIITSVHSKYNWDTWRVDNTVVNQSEYSDPQIASDTAGNLKLDSVSVCYNGETHDDGTKKYIKCTEYDPKSLPNHWNWYVNNQPKTDPIYYTADKSFFIAPAFDSVQQYGIELKGIRSIPDYSVTTTEVDTKVPIYLHLTLIHGVLPYVHRSEGDKTSAREEQDEYERMREEAAQKIANRSTGPGRIKYPSFYTLNGDGYDDDFSYIKNSINGY